MTHDDAVQEMSVEKYLLGELTGDARNSFEDHLFGCVECAQDLKAGVTFFEGMRTSLGTVPEVRALSRPKEPSRFSRWFLNPAWMAPALACSLAVVIYQNGFQVPRIEQQLGQASKPEILQGTVLTGGASRGGELPRVTAHTGGSFLVSVDISTLTDYAGYQCSLTTPSGKTVWQGQITPDAAKESVQIRIPAAATQAGENTLTVSGTLPVSAGGKTETVSVSRFILNLEK